MLSFVPVLVYLHVLDYRFKVCSKSTLRCLHHWPPQFCKRASVCWSPTPKDVTQYHGHHCYETDDCFVPTLPAGLAAPWVPHATVECSVGPSWHPLWECRAGGCKQAGTTPQPLEEMEGRPFSSITTSDILPNPPFWPWPQKSPPP